MGPEEGKDHFSKWNGLLLTLGLSTSSARNENLRPLLNRNIPLISGEYGFRNHVWPLESGFLMRKNEKKDPNFWGPLLPILRLTYLESSCNFQKFGLKKWWVFFRWHGSSGPMCKVHTSIWNDFWIVKIHTSGWNHFNFYWNIITIISFENYLRPYMATMVSNII